MFKDKAHFVEELTKSIQKDIATKADELEKAARNAGGPSNDASGGTPARKAHAEKAKKLQGDVKRLESISAGKPKEHGSHASLARAKDQLEAHMSKQPG